PNLEPAPGVDEVAPDGAQWTAYYFEDREERASNTLYDANLKYAVRQPFKVAVKGDPVPDEVKGDPDLQRIYDTDNDGSSTGIKDIFTKSQWSRTGKFIK